MYLFVSWLIGQCSKFHCLSETNFSLFDLKLDRLVFWNFLPIQYKQTEVQKKVKSNHGFYLHKKTKCSLVFENPLTPCWSVLKSKNPVRKRLKIQFVKLDFSKLIFRNQVQINVVALAAGMVFISQSINPCKTFVFAKRGSFW